MRRFSLSLVEVLVSLLIISMVAVLLSYGWVHYYQRFRVDRELQRIETTLQHANRLSSMTNQMVLITLKEEDKNITLSLQPWLMIHHKEKRQKIARLFRTYQHPTHYSSFTSILFNGHEVSSLVFYFYGKRGLARIFVDDREYTSHSAIDCTLSFSSKKNEIRSISLDQFFYQHKGIIGFPEEYAQTTP